MTDKFAGLSLGVDVSQVDRAVKSLDELASANNNAGKSFDNFINAEQVAKQKMKDLNNEVKRQKKEFSEVEKVIDPTANKMRQLQQASVDLDKLWSKGMVPDKEFFNLSSMIETQINALNRSKLAMTEEGRAALENSKAKAAAKNSADSFLKSLRDQANAATMTKQELLELRAAELGVTAQAAPFIAAMNKQAKATNVAGLSVGEYKNAMRMLPAQITDVVTSLASGMPVWLVAVQQGGQIKDSFGGVGNTFKVLLSYLNPVTVGMTAMGIALAGLAKAGYDSYRYITDMQNALIETGGFSAATAADLDAIATKIADTSNATIGSVRDIATELAKSGKYTQDQIRIITRATAEWSAATGRAASDIISDFSKIAGDPVKGLAKLNEQYNFLEKGQLTYINGIAKTRGETEAVTEATKLFADVMEERMSKIAGTATPLEKMWNDIKKWSSDAWGWVGDHTLGALNLIIDVVSGTVIQVKMILAKGDEYISNFIASAIKATQSLPFAEDFGKDILAGQEKIASESKATYDGLAKDLDEINARVEKGEMGYVNALKERRDLEKQYSKETKDAVEKEAKAIEEANRKKGGARITKGATEQLDKELYVLKAQLKTLQEHTSINDKISSQRKALWSTEAQIAILQEAQSKRKLTNEEKALLTSQQKVLSLAKEKAEIGDQIVAQERINKLNDDSMKFIMQMDAASKSLNETRSMGTREAERQLQLERIKADYMAKGGGEDDQALNNMLDKQKEYYAQEDQLRGDWLAGAQKAFADYGDSATDMYGNVYDIATNSLNGLSDMMTEFLMTGQANFADFAKSIISQIIKMITQMVIFNSISGMMGGSAGGKGFSFANSGWFATGGYTGDGGKYEPAGTVHKGEFVMTKEATKRIGVDNLYRMMRGYANGGMVGGTSSGGGGAAIMAGGVTIGSIPVSINNGSDPKGMEQGVKMIFKQMIQESCSQGGEVYNYINGKAGA
ncbi:tail length tape measure protein [Escherichia phage vB_EcoS_ESCO41]|uniref:Tape measure protein n=1 Tax=Escherichia phage vB_EcoS_ESCO41 TaxID=2496547 RepID=A0A1U9WR13_9CAUD|nr:tail length tape measure protein [Escherichia phage vB_EcoS_ESCO41]AQY55291.1 tail length tape measure protein [Escherichia phage vB_EcoS_ESCO41]